MDYMIQAIVIPKEKVGGIKDLAKDFMKAEKYRVWKVREEEDSFVFPQRSIRYLKGRGFHFYRTKKLQNGIEVVLAFKDPDEADRALNG